MHLLLIAVKVVVEVPMGAYSQLVMRLANYELARLGWVRSYYGRAHSLALTERLSIRWDCTSYSFVQVIITIGCGHTGTNLHSSLVLHLQKVVAVRISQHHPSESFSLR